MAWIYCGSCNRPLDRITFEEIWAHENSNVECKCGNVRDDDTLAERQVVLVNTVYELLKTSDKT